MCMNERRFCQCGRNSAFLMFRDNLLPVEILEDLFCPECRRQAHWDAETMIEDGGWVLAYDVERAQGFLDLRGLKVRVTPEFLFGEGYLSWLGFAPQDGDVNARLHQRLAPLSEQNLALYLETLRREWLAHVAALKAAGWRKAQAT